MNEKTTVPANLIPVDGTKGVSTDSENVKKVINDKEEEFIRNVLDILKNKSKRG